MTATQEPRRVRVISEETIEIYKPILIGDEYTKLVFVKGYFAEGKRPPETKEELEKLGGIEKTIWGFYFHFISEEFKREIRERVDALPRHKRADFLRIPRQPYELRLPGQPYEN